ncbi:MAG: hypothetical protein NVS3B26_22900 [Mycobacteriales bacterium]
MQLPRVDQGCPRDDDRLLGRAHPAEAPEVPDADEMSNTASMAFDEELAARLRDCVLGEANCSERKMFGGLAFLINGHMAVAASGQGGLLLRVDPAQTDQLANRPHASRFVMRGREMDGWLRVDLPALQDPADLERWVQLGVTYARGLPPK